MLYLKGKCVMRDFFCFAETLISGMLPFVFLVFSGIYFTVKSNFFQFLMRAAKNKEKYGYRT